MRRSGQTDVMAVTHHAYLQAIRTEGEALLEAAGSAPDASVPACPGWNARDLAQHIGRIWLYVSQQALTTEPLESNGAPADGEDPLAWAADGLSALLLTLTETEPDASAWNWARNEPNTARFLVSADGPGDDRPPLGCRVSEPRRWADPELACG